MNVKEVLNEESGKTRFIEGVNILADTVSKTMGSRGLNVLIETSGGLPEISGDGFDISNEIFLEDPIQSLGCEMVKEGAKMTFEQAGDNTSTNILLSQMLIRYSHEELAKGKSPHQIKESLLKSKEIVLKYIKDNAIAATEKTIFDVAKTSTRGDESLAKLVAEAFEKAGEYGTVSYTRSETEETFVDHIDGTLMESGYGNHQLFVNNFSDQTIEYENPLILVSEISFKNTAHIMPFIKLAINENGKRPIIIISDMDFELRNTLLKNYLKHLENPATGAIVAVINPPSHGSKRADYMRDLALVVGGEMVSTTSGGNFDSNAHTFIGTCDKFISGKLETLIIPSKSLDRTAIDGKIGELRDVILKSTNPSEKRYMEDRIAKLTGKISIIKAGAGIESELKEKMSRIDDAVKAVRSAKEEGVLSGGGIALDNASMLEGVDEVTAKALQQPIRKILLNSGITYEEAFGLEHRSAKDAKIGYDVVLGKKIDMFDAGVVDCAKSLSSAYSNAVSVAITVLTMSGMVTFKRANNV